MSWDDEKKIETKRQNLRNMSKWRSKRRSADYDRPGRSDKAEKSYRSGKEHFGKTKTLRSHRTGMK